MSELDAPSVLSTGDMARLAGSTLRTVRFYEEAGLLSPEARSDGGHRVFAHGELLRLRLILDLREAGLSLNDIRALFALKSTCDTADEATGRMSRILEGQITDMQQKITKLRKLREELASTIAIISECRSCERARFPLRCSGCEVLSRTDLPRAVKLLWA